MRQRTLMTLTSTSAPPLTVPLPLGPSPSPSPNPEQARLDPRFAGADASGGASGGASGALALPPTLGAAPSDYFQEISPAAGTLVLFDSVGVPHEVMPTIDRERFACSGWFHDKQQPHDSTA